MKAARQLLPTLIVFGLVLSACRASNTAVPSPTTTPPPRHSPQPASNTFGIFSFPPENERAWNALADLGVGWVRLQFRLGKEDPTVYTRVLDEGYGLWLTLTPRDAENVADPEKLARSQRGGFPPVNDEPYKALVTATIAPLVESLRAAGKNPGDWLVIQLGNEVIPSDVLPDQPLRFWHGTADEYLHTLALTYQAVKAVDPSIPVAMTSLSSEAMEAVLSYESGETQYQPIADWAARLLAEAQADWADIHLYHSVETIPDKVAWYRAHWNGLLAASEIGGPDSAVTPTFTEAGHAADLNARLTAALEAGVSRVFWTTLIEQPFYAFPNISELDIDQEVL
ncbi:MAG: hypothetical protein ACE5FD_16750, partial [Anaerolineae bacterium]